MREKRGGLKPEKLPASTNEKPNGLGSPGPKGSMKPTQHDKGKATPAEPISPCRKTGSNPRGEARRKIENRVSRGRVEGGRGRRSQGPASWGGWDRHRDHVYFHGGGGSKRVQWRGLDPPQHYYFQ